MSGHSKWATIKHKKGAADAKRGKIFSKLAKELTIVAKAGGGNPDMNPSLRTIIAKCKSVNMPSDNIDRAIKKGTGEIEGVTYEEVTYEGYAAGGIGLIVKVLTDNKNRAAAEIRHIFTRHGSNFAASGAVSRGFERKGQIFVDSNAVAEDKLMDVVLNAGADDMKNDGGQYEVLTSPAAFNDVTAALEKAGIPSLSAEVSMVPQIYTPVKDKALAQTVQKFIDDLEDNDDVQNVYSSMDIDESIANELENG
jgi:YebC/PmpR family DNA-binding regulatory protein